MCLDVTRAFCLSVCLFFSEGGGGVHTNLKIGGVVWYFKARRFGMGVLGFH